MEFKALKNITKEEFIEICNSSKSMVEALQKCNLHRGTFTKYAKQLGCYNPNVGAKGIRKDTKPYKFNLDEWNNNKLIKIARASLRKWIFRLELLPICCNKCKLDKWLNQKIPLELNHINGNGHDNVKSNLELLCPNCHALTETYRGKNLILKYGKVESKQKDKIKQKEYNKKPKKPNKWHSYSRNREQYLKEINSKFKLQKQERIKIIKDSGINKGDKKWRNKLSLLLNISPQYVGQFVKENIPEM